MERRVDALVAARGRAERRGRGSRPWRRDTARGRAFTRLRPARGSGERECPWLRSAPRPSTSRTRRHTRTPRRIRRRGRVTGGLRREASARAQARASCSAGCVQLGGSVGCSCLRSPVRGRLGRGRAGRAARGKVSVGAVRGQERVFVVLLTRGRALGQVALSVRVWHELVRAPVGTGIPEPEDRRSADVAGRHRDGSGFEVKALEGSASGDGSEGECTEGRERSAFTRGNSRSRSWNSADATPWVMMTFTLRSGSRSSWSRAPSPRAVRTGLGFLGLFLYFLPSVFSRT